MTRIHRSLPLATAVAAIATLATLATLTACVENTTPTSPAISGTATVRFVNATTVPMDFASGGQVARSAMNLGFGGSSACTDVSTATTSQMAILETGSGHAVPGLATAFDPATRYTIVAWRGPASTQFLTVPNRFTPAFLHAGLNVVVVTGGTARYDVYVTPPGGERAATSAAALASGSSSAYFDVAHGARQVQLTTAGTPTTALDAGNAIFTAGTTQTLVVAPPPPGAVTPRFFWVQGC